MKRIRRGYMLTIVVVLLGAVGISIALMSRHISNSVRWMDQAKLDIMADQLLASGAARLKKGLPPDLHASETAELTIPVDDLFSPHIFATLTFQRDEAQARAWNLTARLRSGAISATAHCVVVPQR